MARRIVSLKGGQPQLSAAPLSSASPVPITSIHSIVSDRHMTALGTAATQPIEFGAKSTSLPGDSNSSTDDTYPRHDTYFSRMGISRFWCVTFCGAMCVCLNKNAPGRWHALLCSPIILFSRLSLPQSQIYPSWRTRSRISPHHHIVGRHRTQGLRSLSLCHISQVIS